MKKHQKHEQIIDLDTFGDVSLFQMIPSGSGMGLSHLKTLVDSVLIGNAKLNSLLLAGKAGLKTHSSAFLRGLGIDDYNLIDCSLLNHNHDLHSFFCLQNYAGYVITNIEVANNTVQYHLPRIIKTQIFNAYNYMEKCFDAYDVTGMIIMTTKKVKEVPQCISSIADHIVEIENFTREQLELVILQRLKYAHIDYQDESVLQNIVGYGRHDLNQCIRFLKCSIAVMQAEGRQVLTVEDVEKAGRLHRLPRLDVGDEIPF